MPHNIAMPLKLKAICLIMFMHLVVNNNYANCMWPMNLFFPYLLKNKKERRVKLSKIVW